MNSELIENITSTFINTFKSIPLLVFSPGRINLIGEHTDYNDGFVFPAAIDKGIISAISKSQSANCNITALDVNETLTFSLDSFKPIANGGWKNYVLGIISEILKTGKKLSNFNIVFGGDIPIGAGLSSSAALENSIVYAINQLFKLEFTKKEMIMISQRAEHNFVGVKCGIMDQYVSMFGKKNSALLLDCRSLKATAYNINFKNHAILLINSNVQHNLGDSAYNERRNVCERIAKLVNVAALRDCSLEDLFSIREKISEEDYQKALYVIQENDRVLKASNAIVKNNFKQLGDLLYASHNGLKNQYKVSCDELDFLVEATKGYDSIIGSRMMGGGFGGCTINLVLKTNIDDILDEITKKYYAKFNITPFVYSVNISSGTKKIDY